MRFFLFLILCLSVMTSWSQTPTPQQTPEYWKAKIASDPQNALNYFNLGVIYQKQNDFENALLNYDQVITLKSRLAPVALYYKARIFESKGQIDLTKQTLSSINIDEVPENTRTAILTFKNKIFAGDFKESAEVKELNMDETSSEKSKEEKRLSLYLDASSGNNSNPQSLAPTSTTAIVAETQTQIRAGADYLFSYSSIHDIKANYFYSKTSYAKTSSLNYFYHDFTLPLAFYFDSFRLKLTPEFFSDNYDNSAYSTQTGGIVELTYKSSDSYFSALLQSNSISNKTTAYNYLNGSQLKAQLGYEKRWALFRAGTKLYSSKYNYQDTSTLGSSYQSVGINLNLSYYQDSLDLTLSGVSEGRVYVKASSDTVARADLKTYLSLQIGYNLGSYFRIYAEGNSTDNKSNFDTSANDKTYKQNLILAGLSFNY